MSVALRDKQCYEKEQEAIKNRMIADIAHDLRTPLTSMIGYSKLLKEDGIKNRENCIAYIEIIDRKISELKNMTDQLFEYSSLVAIDTPLKIEKIWLKDLIPFIEMEYRPIFDNKSLTLNIEYDLEAYMFVDINIFIRVFQNMLTNALKYGREKTVVSLKLFLIDDCLKITMGNYSDVINNIDTERLFERFYKGDKSRSNVKSTGLGLAIIKNIVDLHKGKVETNIDKEKDYIEFCISIPNYS